MCVLSRYYDLPNELKNRLRQDAGAMQSTYCYEVLVVVLHNDSPESINHEILETLRYIVVIMQHKWQNWLPLAAASVTFSICSSTGQSTHTFVFKL